MSVLQEVKRAYTDRTRDLDFRASRSVPASSLSVTLKPIGRYNEFSPTRVARAVRAVDPSARVYVGREYSPVLYIKTTRVVRMIEALRAVEADSVSKQPRGWIRAWWS